MRVAWILLLALVVRFVCSLERSLWLDEFHTLHHASAPDLGALFAGLVADNHPPLAFLLVRFARALLGDAEWALRLPSLLAGLGAIGFAARLARWFPGSRAALFGPLLVALSSLHVVVSAEARMYALTSLAVAGLLDALARTLFGEPGGAAPGPGRRSLAAPLQLALWTTVGVHAHYFFLHFCIVIGLALIWLLARERGLRAQAGPLALAAGVTALLSAPWYLYGFFEQFFGHDLEPGGRLDPWRSLPEAFLHLEYHNLSLAGPSGRNALLVTALFLVPLLASGLLRVLRLERGTPTAGVGLLLAAAGVGLPVWAAGVAWLMPRAGFNWVYIAGAVAPFAVLVAYQPMRSRWSTAALGIVAAGAGALSVVNALHAGDTEDYRSAVEWVLTDRAADDALIAIEPGPALFPPALGWTWYAPRLAAAHEPPLAVPERVPLTPQHAFRDERALEGAPRAYLFQRGLDGRFPLLLELRERFAVEEEFPFGYSLRVHRFAEPR